MHFRPKFPNRNRKRPTLPDADPMPTLERRVRLGCAFIVGSFFGFKIAMRVYSGPNIAVGLSVAALVGLVTAVLWDYRTVVLLVLWLFD